MKNLLVPEDDAPGVQYLVCGLGNPGGQYVATRHNVGFFVVDELARREHISLKERTHQARWGRGTVAGVPVALAKPQTFMNRSHRAVVGLLGHLRVSPHQLIIIHDDLDLEPGRLRIKFRGGSGGHRGVDSVMNVLATDEFIRLRMGIGRPAPGQDPVEHVLGEFLEPEQESLELSLRQAAEAVAVIVSEGLETAMNRFNSRGVP